VDYGSDEPLRRAVLTERRPGLDLASLIRAEALAAGRPVAALPPAPEPFAVPNLNAHNQKGVTTP
jgi:hypothetical protein